MKAPVLRTEYENASPESVAPGGPPAPRPFLKPIRTKSGCWVPSGRNVSRR